MKLSAEQYSELESFASLGYNFLQIAKIMGIKPDEFELLLESDPEIQFHYDRGILKADAEIRQNLLSSAKSSITAAQEFKKLLRDARNKDLLESLDSGITVDDSQFALQKQHKDSLDHYYALQDFLNSTPNDELPAELQEYWFRLNTAHDLYRSFSVRSKGRKYIANVLRKKFPEISIATAYRYISEAINFFNVRMTKEDWRNVLTEDLEKVKSAAWQMGNLDLVIKAIKEQAAIQQAAPDAFEIPTEALEQKTIIISCDPTEFGIEKVSKQKLWDMIRQFDIEENDRRRIAGDAGIPPKYYQDAEEVVPE